MHVEQTEGTHRTTDEHERQPGMRPLFQRYSAVAVGINGVKHNLQVKQF